MGEKVTSASYIIGIYQDIEAINDNLAAYKNLLVEFQVRKNRDDLVNISEDERAQMKQVIPTLRFLLIRCFTKISALKKIQEFNTFSIENKKAYSEIIDEAVPDFEKLSDFVISLNTVFIEGVSEDFFTRATNIYSEYMQSNQEKNVSTGDEHDPIIGNPIDDQ